MTSWKQLSSLNNREVRYSLGSEPRLNGKVQVRVGMVNFTGAKRKRGIGCLINHYIEKARCLAVFLINGYFLSYVP